MKLIHVALKLWGLLLICRHCVAQSGYNYARPEVAVGGSNSPNRPAPATGNPLRPGVVGFPTASTAATAFSPAYGAGGLIGGVGAQLNPATAYSQQQQQQQQQRQGLGAGLGTAGASFGGGNAVGFAQPQRPALQPQRTSSGIYGTAAAQQTQYAQAARGATATGTGGTGLDADYDGDYSAIPGVAGVDYPVYSQVPVTNFNCAQQPLPGYYSDVEAQCQVFHICALNRTYSFLCPNGTVFSQETLVCVWWNQYDCASAPSLYAQNAYIYDYGGERSPATTTYQNSQAAVGIGGVARQQTSFPTASTARTAAPATGIYGVGTIRPAVGASSYAGQIGNTPLSNAGYPGTAGNQNVGRYTPTPTAAGAAASTAQSFPAAGAVAPQASAFGGIPVGFNAQAATASTNREYLPPQRP